MLADTKVCPKCETAKALDAFTLVSSGKRAGQPVSQCKPCRASAAGDRKKRDPTVYRRVEWPSKLRRLYGITPEDYYRMLEEQGGGCAVCAVKVPSERHYSRMGKPEMFHVDHCHASGRVRGLLCHLCNRAIGLIRDDPDRAERIGAYLREGEQF